MVPVVLMNPREDKGNEMAMMTKAARSAAAKKGWRARKRGGSTTTKRGNKRRTPARRRKKNPDFDVVGKLIGTVSAAGVGGAAHAAEMLPWNAMVVNAIIGASGLVVGSLVSMYSPSSGMAILGAGVGIAVKQTIDDLRATPPTKDDMGSAGEGEWNGGYRQTRQLQMEAVGTYLPMGAVGTDIGDGDEAFLSAIEAELT